MTAAVNDFFQSAFADYDRTARAVKGSDTQAVKTPSIDLRQGVVTAVNNSASTVDLTLGGDTEVIPGVKHTSNYRPTVNDTVQVIVKGSDLYVIDRLSNEGPSVISGAVAATVIARQTRSAGTWGDLSTVGPTVTTNISPSGRLLVQVSCWLWYDDVDGSNSRGGGMSFALGGANSRTPLDTEAVVLFASAAVVQRETIAASKVALVTGLNPGTTTVQAKYRHISTGDGHGDFELRHLWAMPL